MDLMFDDNMFVLKLFNKLYTLLFPNKSLTPNFTYSHSIVEGGFELIS